MLEIFINIDKLYIYDILTVGETAMTKDEFIDQMLKWVIYYKDKFETLQLRRAMLPKDLSGDKLTYNPFLKFDSKYFNTKLLSNLQALDMVIYKNPNISVYQIKLFIIPNEQFKVLNQVMKCNPYMVEELKDKIHTPIDIAIAYAKYCEAQDKYQRYK